jgi:DNA repair protein RadC
MYYATGFLAGLSSEPGRSGACNPAKLPVSEVATMDCHHNPISRHHFFEPLARCSEKRFLVFHLAECLQVIGCSSITPGTGSSFQVDAAEVFRDALALHASSIICACNTLGLSVAPYAADIKAAKMLIAAGRLLGIEVDDVVIVNAESLHSMQECYPRLCPRFWPYC